MTRSDPAWAAGALLYSGRPDPTWRVPAKLAEAWVSRLSALQSSARREPKQARLGYRGVWLQAPDGRRWFAFDGAAWQDGSAEIREDANRGLERMLLGAAPSGILPRDWPGRP